MKMRATFFLLNFILVCLGSNAQPTAFTTCPNANVAVVRAGDGGANTNPFSIYNINATSGNATLLSGPILNPADTTLNLQLNGLGLNNQDGLMYGLFADAPTALSLTPTTPYYRLGANAEALQLGILSGPGLMTGDNASFIFPNAGEFNQTGTYYFSAATGFVTINIFNLPASTFAPSTFYIGSLAGSNTLTGGMAALTPSYVAITNPSNDAAGYIAANSATITATSAQGLGLQDLVYNDADGHLYTYVSYPDNASAGYFGQMLKINPTTGVMTAQAAPALQSFITATVFPNGTLLDANGNFLIMLTNGDIYQATGTPANYTGALTLLNTAPGLPVSLTGDLASCGIFTIPLPFDGFEFDVQKANTGTLVSWYIQDEQNIKSYSVEYSEDGKIFSEVGTVKSNNQKEYQFTHPNLFFQKLSYYRIKLIDMDGNEQFSSVKVLRSNIAEVLLFPNPIKDQVTIHFSSPWIGKNVRFKVIDNLGQVVLSKAFESTTYSQSVSVVNLPEGVYTARLTSGTLVQTQRIVKY